MTPVAPTSFVLSQNLFPVVGVGASAGGLEAFRELVQAIPPDTGMAYILVQHLAPHYESMLTEILQKYTSVPVLEITDQVKVEPNCIYVIPSTKILVANGDKLCLLPRTEGERLNTIDIFFASLAEMHQDQAIGVLLSGTGSDGTVGLKTIKDVRGLTLVQDEGSAAYYGMPQSALGADVVDFVLPPSAIPGRILQVYKDSRDQEPLQTLSAEEEEVFQQILVILKAKKGVDFRWYKPSTIRRRILRRKAANKADTLKAYLHLLMENKSEQEKLFKDILIPVTSFFRDPQVFATLCERMFPALFKERPENKPIRIWVAGCSTGEEAYSLAICLAEYRQEQQLSWPVQIFATDISEHAITRARAGIYEKRDIAGVSDTRLKQFFNKIDGVYHIHKHIREMCVFAHQNFLTDPPFANMDLISCRNVLIYMEPYLQKKALAIFHYALRPEGWLLLGRSESVAQAADRFAPLYSQEKIYLRKSAPETTIPVATAGNEAAFKRTDQQMKNNDIKKDDYQKAADEVLLQLYAPVNVIINESMDIVQFRGSTSLYLEPPQGKATLNLLKMAKEGLAFELRNALHKVKTTGEVVRKKSIPIDKGKRKVDIEVIPLKQTLESYYVVVFQVSRKEAAEKINPEEDQPTSGETNAGEAQARITRLEKELAQAREDMRAITEDQEAVNEELQSVNEELLSGSEELQSLNEELETSKEEIQSSNEELSMLNQELIERNSQLVNARKYAEAIVTTIHESLIVLNKDLRVKSANKAFYQKFQTRPEQTEGKPFFELEGGQWNIDSLRGKMLEVTATQLHFEGLELEIDFASTGKRMLKLNARPLNNDEIEEQLILLAIEDITESHALKKQLAEQYVSTENELRLLSDFFRDAPAILAIFRGRELICEMANPPYLELVNDPAAIQKSLHESFPVRSKDSFLRSVDEVYRTGVTYVEEEVGIVHLNAKSYGTTFINLMVKPVRHPGNEQITGVFFFAVDVTAQVNARRATETNLRKLLESLYQISWTAASNGSVNFYNNQFYQYTGLSEKQALDQGWSSFVHPDQLAEITNKWKGAVERQEDFHQQLLLRKADQSYRWHMVSAASVTDDKGRIVLWVTTCMDIHEQKIFAVALEQEVRERTRELRDANTDLNHSNENLEQFASVASHDLQEPLRKIKTFISILNRKFSLTVPEEAKEYLGKIRLSADRMSQLIHELLDYSKVAHTSRSFVQVDLDMIINNIISDLDLLITESRATIIYAEPFPWIEAQPLQMNQLFYNLLTNALKFFHENVPPVITISFRKVSREESLGLSLDAELEYWDFSIADNGIGFEPQYAQQIFQIFERLHTREEFEGTGIGLALCKKIVENHRGIIYATSNKNEGTKFHSILPAAQPD